jgi:hypothetical protein
VTVSAELSTASVWQSTVTLAAPKTFTAAGYDGTVRLEGKARVTVGGLQRLLPNIRAATLSGSAKSLVHQCRRIP